MQTSAFMEIAFRIRKGMRVQHVDYGPATVTKIAKDGTVWVRLDDGGTEGTTSARSIRPLRDWTALAA